MIEVEVASGWVYGRLAADAALLAIVGTPPADRIWQDVTPAGVSLPGVVYSFQAGSDLQIPGPLRVWTSMLWQVKGVGEGLGLSGLADIANRIDVALHGRRGVVAGGVVHGCIREAPVSYPETSGGVNYRHLGGLYRLLVSADLAA